MAGMTQTKAGEIVTRVSEHTRATRAEMYQISARRWGVRAIMADGREYTFEHPGELAASDIYEPNLPAQRERAEAIANARDDLAAHRAMLDENVRFYARRVETLAEEIEGYITDCRQFADKHPGQINADSWLAYRVIGKITREFEHLPFFSLINHLSSITDARVALARLGVPEEGPTPDDTAWQ
jgi:hypothetical protein